MDLFASKEIWEQNRSRLFEWARVHLISVVVSVLVLIWLLASWFVFQAEAKTPNANIVTFGKALWWGIVTLLTVGYGDFYPVSLEGRLWASILMLGGVFSIAIITSKISSYFLEQVLREGRGIVDTSQLNNHFVICGWKEEMAEILTHILDYNSKLKSDDLVMIANISTTELDLLRSDVHLKGLHVVCGNDYEAAILKKAAPERARKIMILADRTVSPAGVLPTPTEVDSRTIITAMTLANIARGTLVAAEILDPKMDQYLKLASVSEIIYSREYSRLLIGNAAGGTGVANIVLDLLDPKQPTSIATIPIPERFLGGSYQSYKELFEKENSNIDIIGILENTGNQHRIKELALREAQKTPDVGKLVQNLRLVKELRCNHPVFNPGEDYVIRNGSMAIAVETRMEKLEKHASSKEKISARPA